MQIHLTGATATRVPVLLEDPELTESALSESSLIAGPELMFGCFSLGIVAVMMWLASPGTGRSGIIGLLLLATGVALVPVAEPRLVCLGAMVLSAGALWCETKLLPAVGLYATAGWMGLVVAGLTLYDASTGAHPAAVILFATLSSAGTYVVARRAWNRLKADPLEGSIFLVGRRAFVLRIMTADRHHGLAVVGGQVWPVHDPWHRLREGQAVDVVEDTPTRLIVTTGHADEH